MSEDASTGDDRHVTFNIKSSSDAKHVVTVPESMTVLALKEKLSTTEYADIAADRQRLIYSGRVLKDHDTLAVYKIKDGNTVHMVKGAASNQRQGASASNTSAPAAAAVPQNIATGTGNDPLAGLTGARYAGFAQMPGAGMFGADGGMGAPPSADAMLEMLDNPMFASQMNEAMNNPAVIQMMENNPMVRDNPMMRQMLQNPEMRRMMMDPQFIRQSMQMSRFMNGGGAQGGAGAMPAPGVTDTTAQRTDSDANGALDTQQQPGAAVNPFANPFASGGGAAGGAQNPFAALFGGGGGGTGGNVPRPGINTNGANPASSPHSEQTGNQAQQAQPNPFGSMFGAFPHGGGPQGQQGGDNPLGAMAQQMMQNPEMMRMAMEQMRGLGMMGGGAPGAAGGIGGGAGAGAGAGAFNPFTFFDGGGGGGGGGAGGGGLGSMLPQVQQQQDTRPPEEQFAEQLRQLNDMGFYDFERNVRALRRSGGNVQGAVEALLS